MERAGGQRKQLKVWQIPTFSRHRSTCGSPPKNGFEKRRLTLRSENTDATKTRITTTPQLPFRQAFFTQKQPGKENESPFRLQDREGKSCATITKSTIKRKKPLNTGYITNSEKKIIKRSLSADYEDRLSSKKLFEGTDLPSDPSQLPKTNVDNSHDVKTGFSVYNDGKEIAGGPSQVPEIITEKGSKERIEAHGAGTPCSEIFRNDSSPAHRDLYFLWKSYESCRYGSNEDKPAKEKIESAESPVAQHHEEETSGVEFLIERIDRNEDRTLSMNNYRKIKSGSDIGRLKVPLRRGDDISPLKRRINQLKRSAIVVGKSLGIEKKPPKRYPAAVLTAEAGSRRIERCRGIAIEESKKLSFEGTNHLFPITVAKQEARSSRKVDSNQEPRENKSAGKIPGLLHEILPLDIQYTTDYTKESIDLEHARDEYVYKISRTFLIEKSVTPEQRRIVVNFLISVHAYLLTSSSTLYQATRIFDAILDIKDVSVKELQLVALAASWIAIKNTETKVPSAGEMISFAKDMYQVEGPALLCKCEKKILKTLGFNIRFPDPFYISAYYLQRWSSLATVSNASSILKIIHHSAGYLMEVALLDERYSGMQSALLAAAATQTAVYLVLSTSWKYLTEDFPWNNEQLTSYTQPEIDRITAPLIARVLESAENDSPIGAVYKKYKNARYDNTSDYLITKIKKLSENP